jgi:putative PEP-CTERM system TPR-repeat lipoprotein
MSKHPVALAIALAFATATLLSGCDLASNMTEQEHIQRAKDFEDKGDLKASIVELKNAVQKNPNGPQSRLLLSQLYIKAGLGPSAEKELRKAQQLGINPENIKIPLGEALLLQQKFNATLEEIQASEKTSIQNRARIISLRGEAKLGLGQFDEACELFSQSKAIDSKQTGGYRGLAQCAVARGQLDQAIQQLNTALKIDGKAAKSWIQLADIEVMRSNLAAAEKAYEQAVKVAPENPATYLAIAAFQIRQGNAKAAEKHLDEIKDKFGGNDLGWHSLKALLAFQQNRLEEADTHIGQILRIAPGHIPTLLLAGLTNYGLGRHEQAMGQLSKVLAVAPGLKPARIILSSIKLKQGQVKEAEALIETLDVEHSSDAVLLSLAGQIALVKGDRAQADRYLALASRIDPKRTSSASPDPTALDVHAALKQLSTSSMGGGKPEETASLTILALIQHKEFDRALAAIAQMEKQQPNNPAVHNMRGVVSLARQDWAGARRNFDKAVSLDPDYFQAVANLAQLDLRDGKSNAARQRIDLLLKRNPGHAHAMLLLADISARQGQERDYRDWLEKARRTQPDLLEPALRLGRYHLGKGEPLKALDIARQMMAVHPDNPEAMELLAQSQAATGDKDNAIVSLTRLTALAPQSAGAHYQLARLQIDQKNLRAAKSSLAKAVAIRPDFYEALHTLAMLELGAKKPEEALKIARDAQNRAPQSPAGLILEGDVHMRLGKFSEAAQSFEKALAMANTGPVQIKLHQALRRSGKVEAADGRLLEWMKTHPRDVGVRYYLGEVSMQTRNYGQAIDHFKAVLQLAPQHAMALNNLAWLYDQERNSLALQTAEQAYKFSPNSSVVQDTLGWILLREGQTARSLELLRQAATSKDPSTQFHYAAALAKSGDKDKARSLLKQLLASNRNFPEAKQAEALLKQL